MEPITCKDCKETTTDYYPEKYIIYCRPCKLARGRKARLKRYAQHLEYNHKWHKENHAKNGEALREKQRKRRKTHFKEDMVYRTRQSAKSRGLEHTITTADFDVPERCPLLQTPMSIYEYTGSHKVSDGGMSLDRIDNTKGYIPGNVWIISSLANYMKRNATLEQLDTFALSWLKFRGLLPTE